MLVSRNFSTSIFKWINTFRDVPNTFGDPLWKNVCVWQEFRGHCISKTTGQNFTELYIEFPLCLSGWWLDFGANRSTGGWLALSFDVSLNFCDRQISIFYGIELHENFPAYCQKQYWFDLLVWKTLLRCSSFAV